MGGTAIRERRGMARKALSQSADVSERYLAQLEAGEGNVSVRNECSRPIALMFMDVGDQRVVSAELAPGARFTSDAVWGQTSGFIFTACPVGSRPSVRFALENKETIGVSLYNCVVGRPTS